MRLLLAILLLCLPLSVQVAPAGIGSMPAKTEFGITLTHGGNTAFGSFALVSVLSGNIVRSQPISRETFILQVTGTQYSPANPLRKDLMKESGIEPCVSLTDSMVRTDVTNKYTYPYCPALDDFWKIRYKRDPNNADLRRDEGWATGYFAPSLSQQRYLRDNYGLTHMNGTIFGEKFFQLLKDMQDSTWIENYKNLL